MSVLVNITLSIDSAELLVGYGAGAKVYLYSAATETGSYSLVTSTVIVSGTETYEFWDSAGTSSTWYKSRVGNSAATSFSDYSPAFQVGTPNEYVTLGLLKVRLGVTDTDDDVVLQQAVDSANDWMLHYIGWFVGPSGDASRTFDVSCRTNRLAVPLGVRSVTKLEVASETGGTYTEIASTDYLLRPQSWGNAPGAPYTEIVFSQFPVGSFDYFYSGQNTVRITGSFGPAVVPPSLREIALRLAVRDYQNRNSGESDQTGDSDIGEFTTPIELRARDYRTLDRFRLELSTFSWV